VIPIATRHDFPRKRFQGEGINNVRALSFLDEIRQIPSLLVPFSDRRLRAILYKLI